MKYTCGTCKNKRLDETDRNCWSCGGTDLQADQAGSAAPNLPTSDSDIGKLLEDWEKSGLKHEYDLRWEEFTPDVLDFRLTGYWVADAKTGYATVRVPAILELRDMPMGYSILMAKQLERRLALQKMIKVLEVG